MTAASTSAMLVWAASSLGAWAGDSGYADPRSCGGCHQEIARTYALTGMGRSIYRPRPENQVEDYETHNTVFHQASDRYYTMLQRDGRIYQRRHQVGFDGAPTNIVEEPVDFVIGSGNHVRSYLHRTSQEKLAELPVSWYAENGGFWAMSPGYDTADQLDFRRTVSYECIFCHAAYPAAGPALNFSGSDSVFGETVLESIDCQRCHGPGRTHVEAAATAGQSRESIRRAILNPGRLTRERQLDVCLQCHLETTASFPVASIRRINREPFSYRPGEPLGDFAIFFDQAPSPARDGKFEFVHAAYSLRKSVCFRASQMTCSTCHNPHQAVRGAQAVEQYSAVCRSCHATAHAAAAATNCIDCHMPKRRSDDVVHAAMTDHAIQRRKPERDLLAPRRETHEAYRGEVAPYYPQQATPLDELYLAVAQVRYSANLAVGIPRLQRAIERQRPTRPEFYFELGVACWKDGRKEAAARWYDEALRHGEYFPALKALGEALFSVGRLTRAALVLERALAASPADADLLCARANLYFRQEQFERAGQVLQQALSSNPDLHQARNLQGVVLGRLGDRNAARQAFREAIRIQPGFDLPHINLALLLAGDGDYAQAGHHLRKAIASNPDSVEAHHTYGMVLTRMKSYDQAAVELREALRLAPNLAEAHGDLAEVLALQGHRQESLEHYRRAIELKPELKSRYTP